MKPASSELITEFLSDVRNGRIIGTDDVMGRGGSLPMMCLALDYILYGKNPNKALQITRQAGNPKNPYYAELAWEIHELRTAGEKWAVVELEANAWLAERGQKEITLSMMHGIYKEHRDTIAPVAELMDWMRTCRRY